MPSILRIATCTILSLAMNLAHGVTFTVNTTTDSPDLFPGDGICAAPIGGCSLRAAIMETNALPGADTVNVGAGTYALTIPGSTTYETLDSEGDLDITDHLILAGAGRATTIIDATASNNRAIAANGSRFNADPLQVEVIGMTLRNGTSQQGGCVMNQGNGTLTLNDVLVSHCGNVNGTGGGVYHSGSGQVGFLVLIDSEVSDNFATNGGGINTGNGTLTLVRTLVARNVANGPNAYNANLGGGVSMPLKVATIIDSAFVDNVAGRKGGGLYSSQAQITIERTTFSGNVVLNTTGLNTYGEGSGGGIYIERVWMNITNSTFSNNVAPNAGVGLYAQRRGILHLAFNTFSGNDATAGGSGGSALHILGNPPFTSSLNLRGNIIAGNALSGGTECSSVAPVVSLGYNIDGDGSCFLVDPTDQPSTDPMLAGLAANGGLGATHALLAGSPAVDAVPLAECGFLINEDRDLQVDEDPIDGVDNDGDYRIDEDPPNPADVDQRGVARPVGTACDIGSYEGVSGGVADPDEQIDDLAIDIGNLVASGVLNQGNGNALTAKLDAALKQLAKGNDAAAINQLGAFINQVSALVNSGKLTSSEGQALIDAANAVIDAINNP